MLRITKENMNMLKRISNKKPTISVRQLDDEWKQNLQYMDNISAFPEDWYLRENQSKSKKSKSKKSELTKQKLTFIKV